MFGRECFAPAGPAFQQLVQVSKPRTATLFQCPFEELQRVNVGDMPTWAAQLDPIPVAGDIGEGGEFVVAHAFAVAQCWNTS